MRMLRGFLGLVILGGSLLAVGCGDKTSKQVAAMNDSNIKKVANLYAAYQSRNGWMGPKTEADFKEFITTKMPAENLSMMGVDPAKIDEYFVSERDGKKFKIRFGVGGGPGASNPVVFEEVGKDGVRIVAFNFGGTEEVTDDSRYRSLLEGKATKSTHPTGDRGSRPQGVPTTPATK